MEGIPKLEWSPWRIRRGLIEARQTVTDGPPICWSLRGEFAAASLKRGIVVDEVDGALCLRGEFAAASLKLGAILDCTNLIWLVSVANSPRPH